MNGNEYRSLRQARLPLTLSQFHFLFRSLFHERLIQLRVERMSGKYAFKYGMAIDNKL